MENYREAADQMPEPPPPGVLPQPVDEKPPAVVAGETCEPCGDIAKMTHEQKMEKAIEAANLGPEIMEELGDIKTLVASMVIVGGVLIVIAATGYGAIAEAIAAGLLVLGAAMSGAQIGAGINSMIDFYQKTRCDRAKTPEDLTDAGRSFGDGIAKMGVGGLNLLLALLGARKLAKPAGGTAPSAGETTAHGATRVAGAGATRGGVLTAEEVATVRTSGRVMKQADGATVRILQRPSGKSDVVVDGKRGLITIFKNLSQKSVDRLAKNYGWRSQ